MNDDQRPDRDVQRPGAGAGDLAEAGEEESSARHPARDANKGKGGSFLRELPVLVVLAFLLALLIKAFIIQAFYIPSASMEETLRIQDRVLVNKLVYDFRGIHRGDIVVFTGAGTWDPNAPEPANLAQRAIWAVEGVFGIAPPGHKDYIKRVIGLPGDRVACCDVRGRVTVNGAALRERSYLYPGNRPSRERFEVTVPAGYLWVMGDHRKVSFDSREHRGSPGGGAIAVDDVVGRAFVIMWPPSHAALLSAPQTFYQKALEAAGTAAPAAPLALGLVAVAPFVLVRRRAPGRGRPGQ